MTFLAERRMATRNTRKSRKRRRANVDADPRTQNPVLAAQTRRQQRTHYAAKYRSR